MSRTVLIVEDNDDIRQLLCLGLKLHGYRTFAAANGREALDLLTQIERPCLIVLDLMMPVMNGWEFRARILADPQLTAVPVLIISADGLIDQRAADLGAVSFLRKPIELAQLIEEAQRYCAL
jgi:CheY-like chemotaxis protein